MSEDRLTSPPIGPPDAYRRQGVQLFNERRFADAAAAFADWAGAAPGEAAADYALGRTLVQQGDHVAAEAALRSAVAREPRLMRGHLLLARLALADGKFGQAQAHLRRAAASGPQTASLQAMQARVLLRRVRFEAARRAAQAALDLDPGCDTARLIIAEIDIAEGNLADARPALQQLAERRPHWPELRVLNDQLALLAARRRAPAAPGPERAPSPAPEPPVPTMARAPEAPADFGAPAAFAASPGAAAVALDPVPLRPRPDFLDHLFLLQALILRNLRLHYRDSQFGFLLEYVRPTVVMVFHYFLFVALKKPMPARIPVELFIIGSFTIWFAAVHVLRATGHTGKDSTNIPGVTSFHMAAARALWEFFSMTAYALFCVVILKYFGWREPIPNVFLITIYFFLAVALGFGLGLILLALGRMFAATEALKKNLYWILYVTSGHYFSISQGRHGIAWLVWYNPILHLSELTRQALYPGYPTALVTYWYPTTMALALIILGLLLEKWTRHRARD